MRGLPYRGTFGAARPDGLRDLPLPPRPMASHDRLRPLKSWRYVGVFSPPMMLCVASVRIGRARQSFWAVWDRVERRLHERTTVGRGGVTLPPGAVHVSASRVTIDLVLDEQPGLETVCPAGDSYAWTRKQGGIRARGSVTLEGRRQDVDARAVIDDTFAYFPRHTSWLWCAGVGLARDGRELAWNLVSGVNDPPVGSERTIWVAGEPHETGPCAFDPELRTVEDLRFAPEAVRERAENLLLIRSTYRQPFGTFSGQLPGGVTLAEGYGVMEAHEAWW